MTQTAIPFVFMRGGTSRGPYFERRHLPDDPETLAQVLIAVVGAGHPLNIDGIGGGEAVTTKVAMLSTADDDWADIDYFFAQVSVTKKEVDFKPSCGNMLAGVAPAAIEMGLIKPVSDVTDVKIRAVNSGARIIATVQTPNGITYQGDTRIDGVPGSASPIALRFMDTVGGATGAFLPTGQLIDTIDGIDVTCMDVAMPMAIARAEAFGLTGCESASELSNNIEFMQRMEQIRTKAGVLMKLGDVSHSVVPKFGILSSPRKNGNVCARYFMPWSCHPTMAVTGAQCIASCLLTPGTVTDEFCKTQFETPATIVIEHPSGTIDVVVEFDTTKQGIQLESAGIIRTARKLAEGNLYVPSDIWS